MRSCWKPRWVVSHLLLLLLGRRSVETTSHAIALLLLLLDELGEDLGRGLELLLEDLLLEDLLLGIQVLQDVHRGLSS